MVVHTVTVRVSHHLSLFHHSSALLPTNIIILIFIFKPSILTTNCHQRHRYGRLPNVAECQVASTISAIAIKIYRHFEWEEYKHQLRCKHRREASRRGHASHARCLFMIPHLSSNPIACAFLVSFSLISEYIPVVGIPCVVSVAFSRCYARWYDPQIFEITDEYALSVLLTSVIENHLHLSVPSGDIMLNTAAQADRDKVLRLLINRGVSNDEDETNFKTVMM